MGATLTIIKLEVDGCGRCPFNNYEGREYCTHPGAKKSKPGHPATRPDVPGEYLDPGTGAPEWCPLRKQEVLVAWEGSDV